MQGITTFNFQKLTVSDMLIIMQVFVLPYKISRNDFILMFVIDFQLLEEKYHCLLTFNKKMIKYS